MASSIEPGDLLSSTCDRFDRSRRALGVDCFEATRTVSTYETTAVDLRPHSNGTVYDIFQEIEISHKTVM